MCAHTAVYSSAVSVAHTQLDLWWNKGETMRGGKRVAWSRGCHVMVAMATDRPATGRQCCAFFNVTTNYPWPTELG